MSTKKISKPMDIQKPGEATPDSTSRPILVSSRPILHDPMVKEPSTEAEQPEEKDTSIPIPSSGMKTIQPPEEALVPETSNESTEPETKDDETAEKVEPAEDKSSEAPTQAAVINAVVASASRGSEASEAQKAEEADNKRKQEVQVLVDAKKYVVPIGQMSRRIHNRNTMYVLLLLLVLAAAYLAIDLGLVSVPFSLPVHLFKQSA